jgi:hypothetical protein
MNSTRQWDLEGTAAGGESAENSTRSLTCRRCKRPLRDPVSIARGLGPLCAGLAGAASGNEAGQRQDLEPLAGPERHDVEIRRLADGTVTANIPHSVIHHSPTGWEIGYAGSGPADLALAILNAFLPPPRTSAKDSGELVRCYRGVCSPEAWRLHQQFKCDFLVGMPKAGGTITRETIERWLASKGAH